MSEELDAFLPKMLMLGVEPAIQEQLLSAIPPPSNLNVRPTPTSALPGEFPLCLPTDGKCAPPIDKLEPTIAIDTLNTEPIVENAPTIDTNQQLTQLQEMAPMTSLVAPSMTPSPFAPRKDTNNNPIILPPKKLRREVARGEGPIPLVKERAAISGLLSFIRPVPTSVPVSVVTSIAEALHKKRAPVSGKLQLAPLLSGDPSKPFQCGLCGKHLASKNVYQLHLRSHSGEKPFTCSLCARAFSQKTSLTRHMRSHTGERPFPCTVCGKRFADKERIKIHMRTHTGEKPFACDVCGKQFSQKSTVKRHMSVHTGEKPFKCGTCGKGFANRGNLTAHAKTHAN